MSFINGNDLKEGWDNSPHLKLARMEVVNGQYDILYQTIGLKLKCGTITYILATSNIDSIADQIKQWACNLPHFRVEKILVLDGLIQTR